jgi:hypothetical protein
MSAIFKDAGRRGSALLATFGLVLLVAVICSSMYGYSSQQVFTTVRNRDFLKAKVIAEAGANLAYNKVRYSFANLADASLFPETAFGGGTYDVTFTSSGTNQARLVSVGRCGTAEARVSADLFNQARQNISWLKDNRSFDPAIFTNYAVLAGGKIDWGGGGTITNGGKVRANNKIEMVGGGDFYGSNLKVYSSQQIYIQGSSTIQGDAFAPSFAGKVDRIYGTKTVEQVPNITIPIIDLTPFYQKALENNEVKNGNFTLSANYTPAGGVLWVNGNFKISNGSVAGCIIATGDIDSSTSRTLSSVNGYPVLISRDGSIKITSTPTINGLVYTRSGSVMWTGGGQLTGSIISAGNIDKGGGSDLIVNFNPAPPQIPYVPAADTNRSDYVIITAWQE